MLTVLKASQFPNSSAVRLLGLVGEYGKTCYEMLLFVLGCLNRFLSIHATVSLHEKCVLISDRKVIVTVESVKVFTTLPLTCGLGFARCVRTTTYLWTPLAGYSCELWSLSIPAPAKPHPHHSDHPIAATPRPLPTWRCIVSHKPQGQAISLATYLGVCKSVGILSIPSVFSEIGTLITNHWCLGHHNFLYVLCRQRIYYDYC
jgi:hypothetical protein